MAAPEGDWGNGGGTSALLRRVWPWAEAGAPILRRLWAPRGRGQRARHPSGRGAASRYGDDGNGTTGTTDTLGLDETTGTVDTDRTTGTVGTSGTSGTSDTGRPG
jgi:hypothetical protein